MTQIPPSVRLHFIDSLRGLVMVLMALDHSRDFFSNAHFSPTNLDKTTVALFLTRWVTHFCAPIFIFLAGTSIYLWQARRGSQAAISKYLCKRGLLLLVLTLLVEAWAWDFQHDFRHINGGVLWAIAWSMLAMAVLVKLRLSWLMFVGGMMILGHNAFDWLKPDDFGRFSAWWSVLHTGNAIEFGNGWVLEPYYPLIPWIGVMAVGYGFGKFISNSQWCSPRRLLALGLALICVFVNLRFSNIYGDPQPWRLYPDPAFSFLSFLNCHKYPPSLLYLLMTLGPALIILGLFEGQSADNWAFLQVFGRTPLIFYLLHLYVIHGLAVGIAIVDHGPVTALMRGGIWAKDLPDDYGYGLPGVYLLWLVVLLILWPICRGFEALKAKKPQWSWLNYL